MRSALLSPVEHTARWAPILLGLSIPISVAADGMLLLLSVVALTIILALSYRPYLTALARHRVAQAAILLLALLAVGALYGDRFVGDTTRFLGKYAKLLCIPLLLIAFQASDVRSKGIHALAASFLVVLALSYAVQFGWLQPEGPIRGNSGNAAVFKKDLTHNFLMAFAAFLFVQLALSSSVRRIRWAWLAAAALAIVDVVLLVRGRTGHLVLASLMLYSGYAWRGWRGFALTFVILSALATALVVTPGPFKARIDRTINEARDWQEQSVARESVAARLDYYRNSVRIVAENPLGVGTGGFPKAYENTIRGTSSPPTVNPHNEYLLIAVQIGIVGVAAFLWLLYMQWKLAPSLPSQLESHLARGLVIAFALGCVFNSLLLDHTEGLLYVWLSAVLYGGLVSVGPVPVRISA
jgi:O-antigen ligase